MFARMYFDAYNAWESGGQVPAAWQEAFGAAREKRVAGIGNLLMSMNAHVNRDFPFMLANLGLAMPSGASRKPDHDRGNEVLNRLYDDVLQEIARRWDPTVLQYDVPGFAGDDTTLFQILQGWREQVWRHAEMLVNAPTPEARAGGGGVHRELRAEHGAHDRGGLAQRPGSDRHPRPSLPRLPEGQQGARRSRVCGHRPQGPARAPGRGAAAGGLPGGNPAHATARSSSTGCAGGRDAGRRSPPPVVPRDHAGRSRSRTPSCR